MSTSPTPSHTPIFSRLQSFYYAVAAGCIIFVPVIVGYAAFSALGYALLSISTIPSGNALSAFYASLIGGILLLPPVYLPTVRTYRYVYDYHPKARHLLRDWMRYITYFFIMPLFIAGNALGMTILERSSFDGTRVAMGHLVASSALGGFVFEMIYVGIVQFVLRYCRSLPPEDF